MLPLGSYVDNMGDGTMGSHGRKCERKGGEWKREVWEAQGELWSSKLLILYLALTEFTERFYICILLATSYYCAHCIWHLLLYLLGSLFSHLFLWPGHLGMPRTWPKERPHERLVNVRVHEEVLYFNPYS